MYLNPGNEEFSRVISTGYVDKTGLIGLINSTIDTTRCLTCISRPRRFGKSYAAKMLCAYYDCTCDSSEMFDTMEIGGDASYKVHMNQYHVIYLDMSNILGKTAPEKLITYIEENVTVEIMSDYHVKKGNSFDQTLMYLVENTGRKIFMIIDEWDAPIRESAQVSKEYLKFLRMLFKSSGTTAKIFAGAYMTGILPIKKDGSQSAVSDFREYTFLNSNKFAKYMGFTEEEVKTLCEQNHMSFEKCKHWYDGYSFKQAKSIYNPYSVMMAMESGEFGSYWKQTSVAENLLTYIDMQLSSDNGDLQQKILKLISGENPEVDVDGFNNDFATFNSADDVLTLLIHLGYLSYDKDTKRARIPNEEVRLEFDRLLKREKKSRLTELLLQSEKLLKDTLDGDGNAVAKAIKNVRNTNYAPTYYNNEQSLRYAIKFAYIVCIDLYMKVEELPSGKGLADVVYLPKTDSALPALVIELKWDHDSDTAIDQIKKRNYPAILQGYAGQVILVGIGYDEKTDEHSCRIEKIKM